MPSVASRLHGPSADILGIPQFRRNTPLVLHSEAPELFQFRGTDIPKIVEMGWADCGLCGLDATIESQSGVSVLLRFPETTTRIALLGQSGEESGKHDDRFCVVTEYPEIASSRLAPRYKALRIWKAHGSCESFAFLDAVDGVVDIVDTGGTAKRNGLVVREVLFETCVCLIGGSNQPSGDADTLWANIRRGVRSIVKSPALVVNQQ